MQRVLIIADDLSGAADCASALFKAGLETRVLIEREAGHSADTGTAQAIAIDADTRRLPGDEAARIQSDLYHAYRAPGQLFYKKIDSTLRGNFAEELGAIIDSAGLAIVAPAFPQAGRCTRNGRQYLRETPLEATEVWRDAGIAGVAHIPGMLARQGIRTAAIGLDEIRQGAQRLRAAFETHAEEGAQALVCDAEADTDLELIARASIALARPRFWVGSAGLANHLHVGVNAAPGPVRRAGIVVEGPILTVVGSVSGVSRDQADCLATAGIRRIVAPAGVLRRGQAHPQWPQLRQALELSLQPHHDVLLTIGAQEPVDLGEGPQLCQALARLIAPLAGHIGALIATGGETARAILCAMGAKQLRLAGEVEPGVPVSIAIGNRSIPVITKAGAFGSRETLLRCHAALLQARVVSAAQTQPVASIAASAADPRKTP